MYTATVTRFYFHCDEPFRTSLEITCATPEEAEELENKLYYEAECENTCHETRWWWDDESWYDKFFED